MPVTVGPSTLTINHDRQFLISQPNATMAPQDDVGFYARDTRFVSGYAVTISGRLPPLLNATTVEHFSARYEFMTPELHLGPASGSGADGIMPERSVGFRLERTILEGVHEDYGLTNYATYPVRLLLEIQIESDFADVFDVRNHRLIRRGDLQTTWRPRVGELRSTYRNRSFRRGLLVKVEKAGSKPEYANGRLVFLCELAPRAEWHVCLKWLPVIGPRPARTLPRHASTGGAPVLLSYAYQWSGDVALLQRYRRNAEAALNWLLQYGDRDGDGFQEYLRRSSQGIFNQGWKDSWDAIRHADGSIPEAPIALCELQGYAFDALLRMAEIYDLLKEPERAADLRERARRLYQQFNEVFWWEAEGTYYLGLDKEKRAMETVASNAGHCLASGIVPSERAGRVVDRLMADDMWSGWGIRTLSTTHPGYNPYSYHCGSIWPHDNATIAGGFRRAGRHLEAQRVAEGIFAAAERFDAYRLPELFSGLPRDAAAFPVPYLGANVPQAWAAAAVFRLVAILCGIHTVGRTRTMYVNPDLPDWLPSLTLRNLRAGHGAMELHLERDRVQAIGNTTGFKVVHGRLPRPALVEAPLARS